MTEFFKQFIYEDNKRYSIIIDDTGTVAYAYLLKDDNIISDVWLYNPGPTPETIDWQNKEQLPFLNPAEYVDDSVAIEPIKEESDLYLKWEMVDDKLLVKISLRKRLLAIIQEDIRPGWSTIVKRNGPLAKIWTAYYPNKKSTFLDTVLVTTYFSLETVYFRGRIDKLKYAVMSIVSFSITLNLWSIQSVLFPHLNLGRFMVFLVFFIYLIIIAVYKEDKLNNLITKWQTLDKAGKRKKYIITFIYFALTLIVFMLTFSK